MNLNKKKIIITLFILLGLILISTISTAMFNYQTVDTSIGIVEGTGVDIRTGPGTNFNVITQVNKNEYVRIFAKIGDWYVIQTDKNYIGAISSTYVRLVYPDNNQTERNKSCPDST